MSETSTANAWEADLLDLLGQLSSTQDELLAVLQEKRQCMVRGDIAAMQTMQPRAEELSQRLHQCHDRRAELLTRAKREGLPSDSIASLASALPAGQRESLGKQVKQRSRQAKLLQLECLSNWVLAQGSLLHVSQLLEIVATGGQLKPTYERDESQGAPSGALVDKAV